MRPPGSLLASGRDADIYECGPGLVLRRSRRGRSLAYEAAIMEYLHGRGYPVPKIAEVSDDGRDLVMERINGPSMAQALERAPWDLRRHARLLASLHQRLHEIPAPDSLRDAPVGHGERIVHLDLHPLNVIVGADGPVVIDWANVARGDPAIDVGLVWVLVLAGELPLNPVVAKLMGVARRLFARTFLAEFDPATVMRRLRDVVTYKANDPNMSAREIEAMWRLVERAESTV